MPQTKLFITDLDGTLAGDAAALSQFKEFLDGFEQPARLVYVTGRHLHSALDLIQHDELPQPDTLITDIGTAIYTGQMLREDPEWRQRMQQDWQSEKILDIGTKFNGLSVQDLPTTRRVSFFTDSADTVRAFEQQLTRSHIAHKLIYSADTFVDVLPHGSGKGQAVNFVLDRFYGRDADILISGDTGNDAEMLELGYPSVIVGNGHPELDYLLDRPTVYKATQTHAAGIQEGWEHFYVSQRLGCGR